MGLATSSFSRKDAFYLLTRKSQTRRSNYIISPQFLSLLVKHVVPKQGRVHINDIKSLRKCFIHSSSFKGNIASRVSFEREIKNMWKKPNEILSSSSLNYLDHVIIQLDNDPNISKELKYNLICELENYRYTPSISYYNLLRVWLHSFYKIRISSLELRKEPEVMRFGYGTERAHIFSLSLAVDLWKIIYKTDYISKDDLKCLQDLLKKSQNIEIVTKHSNRVSHVSHDAEIARSIKCKIRPTLSKPSKKRCRNMLRVLKSYQTPNKTIQYFLNKSIILLKQLI